MRGTSAVETDLLVAETKTPDDAALRLLRRSFVQCAHIVNRCEDLTEAAPLEARARAIRAKSA